LQTISHFGSRPCRESGYYSTPLVLIDYLCPQVIGIMAIEMIGAVYCPLPPQSPNQRLSLLIEQTGSRLIIIHSMTRDRFNTGITMVDIDVVINENGVGCGSDSGLVLSSMVTPNCVAGIVFTSGSTGIPKAVSSFTFNH
ncbi:unnamed protein product, partial [Rotaria sp. Silwood2]